MRSVAPEIITADRNSQGHILDIDKAIADINASYEAALVNYVAGLDTDSSYDIDITGPFFGIEWGIAEGNT